MFKIVNVFFVFILLMSEMVHCMECDYNFLNKRAKAYAAAVVRGDAVNKDSMIADLKCIDVKFDLLPNEDDFFKVLDSFTLSPKVTTFRNEGLDLYKSLQDPKEKGRFLLLLGGIISEIVRNVDSVSIVSGAID